MAAFGTDDKGSASVPVANGIFMMNRAPRSTVLLLYGSQKGCAQSIAERVAQEIGQRTPYDCQLLPGNLFKKTRSGQFVTEKTVVVISSTTGNGDPPDNIEKFLRYIKRRTHPSGLLSQQRTAVLGLGDSNYDKFCHVGKTIHKQFQRLGAQALLPLCCADDATGLDQAVEPWIEALVAKLQRGPPAAVVGSAATPPDD